MSKPDDGGLQYPGKRMEMVKDYSRDSAPFATRNVEVEYSGITRRDQCADRIAASIASDLAMYD